MSGASLRGLVLAGWRLLRCNPWSHGGVDYAHDQTLFGGRRMIFAALTPIEDILTALLEWLHTAVEPPLGVGDRRPDR